MAATSSAVSLDRGPCDEYGCFCREFSGKSGGACDACKHHWSFHRTWTADEALQAIAYTSCKWCKVKKDADGDVLLDEHMQPTIERKCRCTIWVEDTDGAQGDCGGCKHHKSYHHQLLAPGLPLNVRQGGLHSPLLGKSPSGSGVSVSAPSAPLLSTSKRKQSTSSSRLGASSSTPTAGPSTHGLQPECPSPAQPTSLKEPDPAWVKAAPGESLCLNIVFFFSPATSCT